MDKTRKKLLSSILALMMLVSTVPGYAKDGSGSSMISARLNADAMAGMFEGAVSGNVPDKRPRKTQPVQQTVRTKRTASRADTAIAGTFVKGMEKIKRLIRIKKKRVYKEKILQSGTPLREKKSIRRRRADAVMQKLDARFRAGDRFSRAPYTVWNELERMDFDAIPKMSVETFTAQLAERLYINVAIVDADKRKEAEAVCEDIFGKPRQAMNDYHLNALFTVPACTYEESQLYDAFVRRHGPKIRKLFKVLGIDDQARTVVILNKDLCKKNGAWEKHIIVHEMLDAISTRLDEVNADFADATGHANKNVVEVQLIFAYVMGGVDRMEQAARLQRSFNALIRHEYGFMPSDYLEPVFDAVYSGELYTRFGLRKPTRKIPVFDEIAVFRAA